MCQKDTGARLNWPPWAKSWTIWASQYTKTAMKKSTEQSRNIKVHMLTKIGMSGKNEWRKSWQMWRTGGIQDWYIKQTSMDAHLDSKFDWGVGYVHGLSFKVSLLGMLPDCEGRKSKYRVERLDNTLGQMFKCNITREASSCVYPWMWFPEKVRTSVIEHST